MPGPFMRVEMLPALHGDCLLVEYGEGKDVNRILIDGGPIGAYESLEGRIDALPDGDRGLELIVLTHVDTDHVDGLIRLFANPQPWPFVVDDVWFNGWRHLKRFRTLGGKQGEYFSALLLRRLGVGQWNGAFKGKAVVVPKKGNLPEFELSGGMTLTLLSPTSEKLGKMRTAWQKQIDESLTAGDLDEGWELLARQKRYLSNEGLLGSGDAKLNKLLKKQSRPDKAAANGSSIAFLAEYKDKSCLFLADAHAPVICDSLKRLLVKRGLDRLKVNAVKVAHHGSKGNVSDRLMSLIEARKFLISTNGDVFEHPDQVAVQRIIGRSTFVEPELCFNYLSSFNKKWRNKALQKKLKYKAKYPKGTGKAMVVEL